MPMKPPTNETGAILPAHGIGKLSEPAVINPRAPHAVITKRLTTAGVDSMARRLADGTMHGDITGDVEDVLRVLARAREYGWTGRLTGQYRITHE